jgi:hypothetical protein
MSDKKKTDTFFCLFCGWIEKSETIDSGYNSMAELADNNWLVADNAKHLFPDNEHHKYYGYCSLKCKHSVHQPIRPSGYYNQVPLYVTMLSNARWNHFGKKVQSIGGSWQIVGGKDKLVGASYYVPAYEDRHFSTREEALELYKTDKYLASMGEHLKVWGPHFFNDKEVKPNYEPTVERRTPRPMPGIASSSPSMRRTIERMRQAAVRDMERFTYDDGETLVNIASNGSMPASVAYVSGSNQIRFTTN